MTRRCGDCQLCCKLLPVAEIGKPALTRCTHQCRAGCAIYETKPISCAAWSCLWLQGEDTGPRPDRAHLAVDPMPDYIVAVNNETGEEIKYGVWQVWCDPAHRDAHRAPAFRRWVEEQARDHQMMVLIRYGSRDGFLLCAPQLNTERRWIEKRSGFDAEPQHTVEQVREALAGQIALVER
jgi:hypothetical protein